MISEVIHKEIQVDPQLLFQRLITAKNYANEDADVLFKHELCAVPASLFAFNGLPTKANKPVLAEAIEKVISTNVEYLCQLTVQYVLDGGSLLQHLLCKRESKFSSIYDSYVSYIIKKYNKTVYKTNKLIGPILQKHWHIIEEEESLQKLWPRRPILALKRKKNIRYHLVHTTFTSTHYNTTPQT